MDVLSEPWLGELTPVLETALDAVVVMREDGTIAGWNAVAERVFGWTRDQVIGEQLSDLIIPQRYRENHHKGLARYLATGTGPLLDRRVEISALRSSGGEFPIELSITAARTGGERLFVGFLRDISARKEAETALKESEARLAATYNHALVGIAEVDSRGRFLRANDQFSVMTGYDLGQLRTMSFLDITHAGDFEKERELFERLWSGKCESYTSEKRYVRKDGETIWVELAASLVRNEDGTPAYGVRILRDVTDRKRAEEQQRLLLHELNHRVKNTLTVVQGLAHQTFRRGAVPDELMRSFEGRLQALAAAHNLLMQQTWEATPIGSVVEAAIAPFQSADETISVEGPTVLLTPSATVTLTLALHELATNAAKYGALSKPGGGVDLRWSTDEQYLRIVWREHGGPAVKAPTRQGFGTRLLERGVGGDLSGSLELKYAPEGVSCTISAPLDRVAP